MALHNRSIHTCGDTQADIRTRLDTCGASNGYPAVHYADAVCRCGGFTFRLALDDTEGAAVRTCPSCGDVHPMADGAEYLTEATLEECGCPCGAEFFELTLGVALYSESRDARWLYVGARCPTCGLTACYGDWKLEGGDFDHLLAHT